MKRTNTCGDLRTGNIGEEVLLNGWVSKRRDLGGIIFIDIRDRYGITQLKISPEKRAYTMLHFRSAMNL